VDGSAYDTPAQQAERAHKLEQLEGEIKKRLSGPSAAAAAAAYGAADGEDAFGDNEDLANQVLDLQRQLEAVRARNEQLLLLARAQVHVQQPPPPAPDMFNPADDAPLSFPLGETAARVWNAP
jgi:hypothetical protein